MTISSSGPLPVSRLSFESNEKVPLPLVKSVNWIDWPFEAMRASSLPGAVAKATRDYVKALDRKQRFDMNKGLKIEALRVTSEKGGESEGSPEAHKTAEESATSASA